MQCNALTTASELYLELVPFTGPTAATQLAGASRIFRSLLNFNAILRASATCSLMTRWIADSEQGLMNPIKVSEVFASPESIDAVYPNCDFFEALCCACSTDLDWSIRVKGFDDIITLMAQGATRHAVFWCTALRRHALAKLLCRFDIGMFPEVHGVTESSQGLVEAGFRAILTADFVKMVICMANGFPLDALGPSIDCSCRCCQVLPLAACAFTAKSNPSAAAVFASIMITARADVNAPCPGSCGMTALDLAVKQGPNGTRLCTMLVRAGAEAKNDVAVVRTDIDSCSKAVEGTTTAAGIFPVKHSHTCDSALPLRGKSCLAQALATFGLPWHCSPCSV